MRISILVLAGFLCALTLCEAQSTDARLVGTVTDQAGSAIAGADVTLTNQGTNVSQTSVTNSAGDYVFPNLVPGDYSVSVKDKGFKQFLTKDIKLDVNQVGRVNAQLQIGEVSESVEVTAAPVLLETDSSEIGHVVTNKEIEELPLNGRDFLQLARLIPGVTPSQTGATAGQKGVTRGFNSIGARDTSVSYLLDGIDTNDVSFQTPTVSPSVDAIQEFKVLQDGYSAEFGRGATQVVTATKSGTNSFHGTVYEFNRYYGLASRSFFLNSVAPLRQNQYGGAIGGPVILPKFNGRNHTFFFANYEGQRISTGGNQFADVPTQAQVKGDFSAPGNPIIYDPSTLNPATGKRTAFAGNIIPSSDLSKRGQIAASLFPAPNYSGSVAGNNYVASPPSVNNYDQGTARIDQKLGDKDNFFARYAIIQTYRTRPAALVGNGNFDDIRGQNAAANWVHIFSPSLVNEFRLGFNRNRYLTPPETIGGANSAASLFGFTNTSSNPVTSAGLPQFSLANGLSGLGPGSQFPQDAITQTWQLVENVSWQKGSHNLKFGTDMRSTHLNQIVANNDRGSFGFTGQFTSQSFGGAGGYSLADLLLGDADTAAAAVGDEVSHFSNYLFAFYANDDWHATSRLTINLGVRYEYPTNWKEKLNKEAILNFSAPGGELLLAGTANAFVPGLGVVPTGGRTLSDTILQPNTKNVAPRVGLAYQATPSTVLRAAYGIFYDVEEANELQFLRNDPPYFFVQNYTSSPTVPNLHLDNLFPSPASLPSGTIQPFTVGTQRTPYVQQWNFNVQQKLPGGILWTVGYAGSKGTRLLRRTNYQQGVNILANPANPTPLINRVSYPNFSPTVLLGTENAASSTYHGLITSAEKRYSYGLSWLTSFTWSKSIDDASSSSNFTGTPSNAQCRCDLRGEKGPSGFDTPYRFVASYSYELPFGKGKPFLNRGGLVDKLVGGWQLNGIFTIQSGIPFQVNDTGDLANIGTGAGSGTVERPNVIAPQFAGINTGAGIEQRGVNAGTYYFNPGAFSIQTPYTLGNLGKNTMYGPGFANWDSSFFKNTAITERLNTQFRFEVFNSLNQNAFGLPGSVTATPTFGKITSTITSTSSNGGRVVQLALKLIF